MINPISHQNKKIIERSRSFNELSKVNVRFEMLRIAALLSDLDNQRFAALKHKKLTALLSNLDKKRFASLLKPLSKMH